MLEPPPEPDPIHYKQLLCALPRFARIRFVADRLDELGPVSGSIGHEVVAVLRRMASRGGLPDFLERNAARDLVRRFGRGTATGASAGLAATTSALTACAAAADVAACIRREGSVSCAMRFLGCVQDVVLATGRPAPVWLAQCRAQLEMLAMRSRLLLWDDETAILHGQESEAEQRDAWRRYQRRVQARSRSLDFLLAVAVALLLGPKLVGDAGSPLAVSASAVCVFAGLRYVKNRFIAALPVWHRYRHRPRVGLGSRRALRLLSGSRVAKRYARPLLLGVLLCLSMCVVGWWVHAAMFGSGVVLAALPLLGLRRIHPSILVLGRSGEAVAGLYELLAESHPHRRITSLLDDTQAGSAVVSGLMRIDSLRRTVGDDWEAAVRVLIRQVEHIVVDARVTEGNEGFLETECEWLVQTQLAVEAMWIVDPAARSPVVDRVESRVGQQLLTTSLNDLFATLTMSRRHALRHHPAGVFVRAAAWWLGVSPSGLHPPRFDAVSLHGRLERTRRHGAAPSVDDPDEVPDRLVDQVVATRVADELRRRGDVPALAHTLAELGRCWRRQEPHAEATDANRRWRRVILGFAVAGEGGQRADRRHLVDLHLQLSAIAATDGRPDVAVVLAGQALALADPSRAGGEAQLEATVLHSMARCFMSMRHRATPVAGTLAFIAAARLGIVLDDMGVRRKGTEAPIAPGDPDHGRMMAPETWQHLRASLAEVVAASEAALQARRTTPYDPPGEVGGVSAGTAVGS